MPRPTRLVASAATSVGDKATADMAATWLLNDLRPGGWGTPWAWDPFGDGSITAAGTPFANITALAIVGLLDHGVDEPTARRLADIVLTWARDGWSDGFYWYSLAPQDAIYTPNVSALMAGATARFLAARGDLFSPEERAFLKDRIEASFARLGDGDAGHLRWIYSDRQDIVNDLNHHGYILWGAEMARDAGFQVPWSRADALSSLDEYDAIYPLDAKLTPGMSARYGSPWQVSGSGTALSIAARYGGNVRPWARMACVALERAPFYPRFAAQTLLGFAWAGMSDHLKPPAATGTASTGC